MMKRCLLILLLAVWTTPVVSAAPKQGVAAQGWPDAMERFIESHCLDCHDAATKKGALNLELLTRDMKDAATLDRWVLVHDYLRDGEMPPPKKKSLHPKPEAKGAFLASLSGRLVAADLALREKKGRATIRRLNRLEYENAMRDLFGAPWLLVARYLPEDGEAHHFNKSSKALDVSHVQMARYLHAADAAMREVLVAQAYAARIGGKAETRRYYAREQSGFARRIFFNPFNRSAERATFPLIEHRADVPVLERKAPVAAGPRNPKLREKQAMGVVAGAYEPLEVKFNNFKAPVSGRYKLRFNAYTFRAASESDKRWWRPSRHKTFKGTRDEPVVITAETPPRLLRRLGQFDVHPEPSVKQIEVNLLKGEIIRPDAARLFRSRPPAWRNPLAKKDDIPGVAYKWMEAEGPLLEEWPTRGYRVMFGDLPLKAQRVQGADDDAAERFIVTSKQPRKDAERLLRAFMKRAYRRPVQDEDVQRILAVIHGVLDAAPAQGPGRDVNFAEAMLAGYATVLCSPGFLFVEEQPGKLDDHALATRLSLFLTNGTPDAELRQLADAGKLTDGDTLRKQTDRLLDSEASQRFINAFLDYWLDLRKVNGTSPDATLYPDYYLDDLLVDSAVQQSRAFFAALLKRDLPAKHLIDADFAMVNERLADHYDLPAVKGIAIRQVKLPDDSPRGGLLTHASVLKVTANGTTTSPVTRGVWMMERILGQRVPPPPAAVPAIEPDTRGARTIREQLEKHRAVESCNGCHKSIDPVGFALESFDILGGWRDQYRALEKGKPVSGRGKNGQPFVFKLAQHADASGSLPDGRAFKDIRELKALLLQDERQIARNMIKQFLVYATGEPASFADRAAVEHMLDRAKARQYGVRSLVHAVVQSELFGRK